jgi:hypothetical protein
MTGLQNFIEVDVAMQHWQASLGSGPPLNRTGAVDVEFPAPPRLLMWTLRQRLVRLDRVCAAMNGWLLAIVIGLMVLDFTVLVVKALDAAPLPPG